jgi:hypothetical protein
MERCELYQALLLEYLYDLLEGHERQSLETHLAECAGCRAALETAKQQQQLLAKAAKTEFAGVRFQAPAASEPAPATIPMPSPVRKSRPTFRRWALAAAVLLAVGVGGSGIWVSHDYAVAKGKVDEQRFALANESAVTRGIEESLAAWPAKKAEATQKVVESINKQQYLLEVTGPKSAQPGAPNEYLVRAADLTGTPTKVRLTARIVDQAGKDVFKTELSEAADHKVVLPPSIELRPNKQVRLEFIASRADVKSQLTQQLDLIAPVYMTHLVTDKPMYQPGETVHYRSLTLERFGLTPPKENLNLVYTLVQPNGAQLQIGQGAALVNNSQNQPILGPDKQPVRGIGAGEFRMEPGYPGGEYTLRVSELANRFPPQERKFLFNEYQAHKLDKKLDFSKKSYGPGEDVSAACSANRAGGGGQVANRPVFVMVKVDNVQYGADGKPSNQPFRFQTGADGKVVIRFKLPTAIQTGIGTVGVTFDDGGNTETMVKPIPIVLKKLDVQFFPEGGDLIAGVENRVYFQVRNTLGKPADLKGHVIDAAKKTVVNGVETLTDAEQPGVNQGLGAFAFTPAAGDKYELKIDSPANMEGVYALPEVKAGGVVLTIPQGVTGPTEPITSLVRSADADRKLLVGAYCRGRLLDHKAVTVKKGEEAKIDLTPTVGAGGVYRVTVFEERGTDKQRNYVPVAERLVYRQPAEELQLAVKSDKKVYTPGEKVKLGFTARNELEKLTGAILMVGVADNSIVTMADEKTRRAMPTHFLMTSEVKKPEDLEYADFLIGAHPKAAKALDLLLGTQGWRRFAEQDPTKFKKNETDEADRLLVSVGLSERPVHMEQEQIKNVENDFAAKKTELDNELREANDRVKSMRADSAFLALVNKVDSYDEWFRLGRQVALPMLCLVLLVVTITALIAGTMQRIGRAVPLYVMSAACGVLLCVLVVNYVRSKDDGARMASNDHVSQSRATALQLGDREKDKAPRPMPQMAPEADRFGVHLGEAEGLPKNLDKPADAALRLLPAAPEAANAAGAKLDGLFDKDKDAKEQREEKLEQLRDGKPNELFRRGGADRNAVGKGGAAAKFKDAAPMAPAGAMPPGGMGMMGGPGMGMVGGAGKGMMGGPGMQGGVGGQPQGGGPGLPVGGGGAMPGMGGMMGGGAGLQGGGFGARAAEKMPAEAERQFRRGLQLDARRKRADRMEQMQSIILPPLIAREYAHFHTHGTEPSQRRDATETVYWNPVLVLADGKGEVSFDLSDQVTSFEVVAYGHTLDGRLGSLTHTLESRIPLAFEAKMPIEVTAGDKIDLPVAVANNTDKSRPVKINANFSGLSLIGDQPKEFQLAADARTRRIYRLQPTLIEGDAEVSFTGADSKSGKFRIVPDGFPIVASKSDLLEKSATNEVVLPESWIKGTLKMNLAVYPSTLADLQNGLDALLREPNGCFEQTSTSNYPNLLILNYLKESDQTKPELEKRARDLLARGYQRLVAYECPKTGAKNRQGFEWFGSADQQHEALTAYGLLQFRDMSRVMDVDPTLIERTTGFLMAQRDGKGGFKRNPRALDTFGRAPENITNAYIIWAITGSGQDDDVATELEALSGQARGSKDPYFLALVANSLINRGKTADAVELLKKIAAAQQADGHVDAAQTSITGSAGRDLQIETTALSVLGWLKANPGEFNPQIRKAISWIGQQRGGYGGFGSTQSTILALKALIEHAKANKKAPEAGTITLFVADKAVAKLDFPADAREALEIPLPNAEKVLKPGTNNVRVEITGQNTFPYTLTWSYRTLKPASDAECPVKLTTSLDRTKANEGETVTLNVAVENPSDAERSMVVAIVGLPAGLTLPEDLKQLKEHAQPRENGSKPGRISYFEIRGRELILYWRGMGPKQKLEVPVELICRVPGEYRGPASRAYMYYNADHKHWVEPLSVNIAAKSE